MRMQNFDLGSFIPYQVSVLAGRLSTELESRYRKKFGIRVPEWRIVVHLSQSGPASVRELEVRVDMHKSRVSRAARRLERAGYVSRCMNSHDKRLIDLDLTEKGRAMMAELAPLANSFQHELLQRLGHDRDHFRSGVAALLDRQE